LEHELRLIKVSKPSSVRRLFPWLWRRLRDTLIESKEDTNATAVDSALKAGPSSAAKAGGAVNKPGNTKTKRAKAKGQPPNKPSAPKKEKAPPPTTEGLAADAKHKAKPWTAKPKGPDTRTPEQKASTPCRYFAKYGSCNAGADCAFSHDAAPPNPKENNNKSPPPKAKGKGKGKSSGG